MSKIRLGPQSNVLVKALAMRTEEDLLHKLEQWLALQPKPPTIFDVCATRDGEILAAFILKGAREATRDPVVKRITLEAPVTFGAIEMEEAGPLFRVWEGLSRAWSLSEAEQVALLGLGVANDLRELRSVPLASVPTQVIERIAILLDIFKALNTLLPRVDAADAWIRKPNRAPVFCGETALNLMMTEGLPGLREVRAHLQSNLY